ncbi:MAG TPA: methionine--tRNA ligase [Acidimicrobiales bacterium]|nr:methionine--tRNA ligase [Acidimicrobiales bacterium]
MRVFIGVAWPYASGPRHLGHLAGAYLPADVVARYHRIVGDEVLMVSGSDQHGTPITLAAEAAGVSPADFADHQHARIEASLRRAGISFDHYSRTGAATHHRVVGEVFADLWRAGLIYQDTARSAWCPAEGRSLPDRYVQGGCPYCKVEDARGDQCDGCGRTLDPDQLVQPTCRRCGAAATFRPMRQLFLALDRMEAKLTDYVEARAPGWRRFVAEETRGILAGGLRARAITRDLDWGVRVPLEGWDDRRLYVWFDAVIGYLSASKEWADAHGRPEVWRQWWEDAGALHRYFIGKDNLFFHTLFWPALIMGTGRGLHLPDDVVASQYLTMAGAQMSSSRGHGFDLDDALGRLGADRLRHALCARSPESSDTEFNYQQAGELTRTGLLGGVANPAHRVTTLLWSRFGGRPDKDAWAGATVERAEASEWLRQAGKAIARVELRSALEHVHALGRTVNQRLARSEPWRLPDAEAQACLTSLLPYLEALAVAAWPIVPETASRIRLLLGRSERPTAWAIDPAPPRLTEPLRAPLDPSPGS